MSKSNSEYSSSSSECEEDWAFKILNNEYIIIKKLGKGSYASVWMTYNVTEAKYFAIKISNREDYEACLKEAKMYEIIQKYKCPHIMNIKCTFNYKIKDDLYHCKIMDLMGESLYDYIHEDGIFSIDDVINITKQVLLGINELHKNDIIHGDIKPENILMTTLSKKTQSLIEKIDIEKIIKSKTYFKDQKNRKKIIDTIKKIVEEDISTDFEENSINSENEENINSGDNYNSDSDDSSCQLTISSSKSSDDLSKSSDNFNETINDDKYSLNVDNKINVKITDMGGCVIDKQQRKKQIQTCYYMAPEILLRLPYDKSSDIWALGCTVYEILTGKILFDPDGYDGNEDRLHLYLISKYIGPIPEDMINNSRYKDILFSADSKRIKGFRDITFNCVESDIKKHLEKKLELNELNQLKIKQICNFVKNTLLFKNRISVEDALQLPIFSK
jgi:serine/threonine-protein kinase SRPK3